MEKVIQRCIETVRTYAAAISISGKEVKVKQPKTVAFYQIDEHDDLWGISANCLYRLYEGQCYRYPFDYKTFMAMHILTRNKLPTRNPV